MSTSFNMTRVEDSISSLESILGLNILYEGSALKLRGITKVTIECNNQYVLISNDKKRRDAVTMRLAREISKLMYDSSRISFENNGLIRFKKSIPDLRTIYDILILMQYKISVKQSLRDSVLTLRDILAGAEAYNRTVIKSIEYRILRCYLLIMQFRNLELIGKFSRVVMDIFEDGENLIEQKLQYRVANNTVTLYRAAKMEIKKAKAESKKVSNDIDNNFKDSQVEYTENPVIKQQKKSVTKSSYDDTNMEDFNVVPKSENHSNNNISDTKGNEENKLNPYNVSDTKYNEGEESNPLDETVIMEDEVEKLEEPKSIPSPYGGVDMKSITLDSKQTSDIKNSKVIKPVNKKVFDDGM